MDDKEKLLLDIKQQWKHILQTFGEESDLRPREILVIGCSSSEVLGQKIGTASSKEVADTLIDPLLQWADKIGIFLAFQCCEHLNRVLVVESQCAEWYGLEPVVVLPSLKAGGAMALAAWERLCAPVAVEQIKAHGGIDIGDTLIGMHLKPVVVPVRLDVNTLGSAHVTLAKTRAKYVGGPRACYPCN